MKLSKWLVNIIKKREFGEKQSLFFQFFLKKLIFGNSNKKLYKNVLNVSFFTLFQKFSLKFKLNPEILKNNVLIDIENKNLLNTYNDL